MNTQPVLPDAPDAASLIAAARALAPGLRARAAETDALPRLLAAVACPIPAVVEPFKEFALLEELNAGRALGCMVRVLFLLAAGLVPLSIES